MRDELAARQAAIRMRLAGEKVEDICRTRTRTAPWFPKWWRRYREAGPTGLYDTTRARRHVTNRTPPILSAPSSVFVSAWPRGPGPSPAMA